MTLTRWLHSYLRACLITGSPAQAWRSGRPYLLGAAPWLRMAVKLRKLGR